MLRRIALSLVSLVSLVACGCDQRPVPEGPLPSELAAQMAERRANPPVDPPAVTEVPPATRDGEDWPVFLGPRRDGTVDMAAEQPLDLDWSDQPPPVAWTRSLGAGYTAPSVLGNRCVLFHRELDDEVVECVRADTGQTLWVVRRPSAFVDPYGYSNGPRCAPLLHDASEQDGEQDGERGGDGDENPFCITFGAEGRLMRTDLVTGAVGWTVETAERFEVPRHFFGVGCTPVIDRVGDRLLVFALVGGQPESGVVAFDATDGAVVWESVGKSTWDGAERPKRRGREQPAYEWTGSEMLVSYSSPMLATINGQRHLLCLMRQGLVSLDPADGRVRFSYWFRSPIHESVNAARPVVVDDTILITAPYDTGCHRLRVADDGESVERLWTTNDEFDLHFCTPIHHDGHYYGFHGRNEGGAELRCIDAETGELKWANAGADRGTVPGPDEPYPFFGRGSAILAGETLVLLGERGTLATAKATPTGYEEISRIAAEGMGYPSWPAPVVSRGRLFLRDNDTVTAYDLR